MTSQPGGYAPTKTGRKHRTFALTGFVLTGSGAVSWRSRWGTIRRYRTGPSCLFSYVDTFLRPIKKWSNGRCGSLQPLCVCSGARAASLPRCPGKGSSYLVLLFPNDPAGTPGDICQLSRPCGGVFVAGASSYDSQSAGKGSDPKRAPLSVGMAQMWRSARSNPRRTPRALRLPRASLFAAVSKSGDRKTVSRERSFLYI